MEVNVCGKVKYLVVNDVLYLEGIFGGKLKRLRCDARPYFFLKRNCWMEARGYREVEDIVDVDLVFRDSKGTEYPVVKVYVDYPYSVARLRTLLEKNGVRTFEADIPFVRRLETDKKIDVKYRMDNVVYLDIETDDRFGFPSEYGKYRIDCVGVMDVYGDSEWFYYKDFGDEKEMLIEFLSWMQKNKKSVIVGWNVKFDYNHLCARVEELGIPIRYLMFCDAIDLKEKYEFSVKGLSSYSLAEVSEYEGWRKKGREKKIHLMSRDELEKYNMYDVELLRMIDEKYGFISLELEVANFTNLQLEDLTPLRIGDTVVLRRLRELGYVAKNSSGAESDESYTGAFVMTPVPGIHRNVVVYDFEAMYPNIIINEKIDIEGFDGEVLPYVVQEMKDKRMEYKRMYKETGDKKYDILQKAMKPILNSLYGILGLPYFRYFDKDKAKAITGKGRDLIMKVINYLKENFYVETIYSDTDSVFVNIGNRVDNIVAFSEVLLKCINEYIYPYKMDVDKIFRAILFLADDHGEGVKKRYVGVTIDGDWKWRGLETRRSDICSLAKRVMKDVVKMLLVDRKSVEEIVEYLYEVKTRLFSGEYDDELVLSKGIKDSIDEYVANTPQKRAWQKLIDRGVTELPENKIRYVWYNGDVEPIISEEDLDNLKGRLDYKYYWDNQIYPPIKRILKSIRKDRQSKLF